MTDEQIQAIIDELFWNTPICNVTKHDHYHDRFCTECGYLDKNACIMRVCKRVISEVTQ